MQYSKAVLRPGLFDVAENQYICTCKSVFDNEKILLITLIRHIDSTLMQQDS